MRSAPTLNAEEIFKIHEGTKVMVIDAIDNWKKITLADGNESGGNSGSIQSDGNISDEFLN